ncbi:MAG: BatA domain-containing protein [Pirellula sp.]|nr:BatA domain-containing protein [Pirellula sp.]
MSFLHLSLLAGGLLAVAPVLLHLLGRKQPKVIVFPAIRFVRQTAVESQKGWSIRRWLLMLLRVLLVALAAIAFASPRVPSAQWATVVLIGLVCLLAVIATAIAVTAVLSQRSRFVVLISSVASLILWLLGGAWFTLASVGGAGAAMPILSGPIAAAIVIDTSPSMDYMYQNQSRLQLAKETASWLMDRLPIGSQIAICNSDGAVRLLNDRTSANRQLEKTEVEGRSSSMIQRISSSIEALKKSDLQRREIYILTDLNSVSWKGVETPTISKLLSQESESDQSDQILLQIVDLSIPKPDIKNWGLSNIDMNQKSATAGGGISIEVEVAGVGGDVSAEPEQMTVEFAVEGANRESAVSTGSLTPPDLMIRDRQLVSVQGSGAVKLKFEWRDLMEGLNNAEIRIARPDPLMIDNKVFLSVETMPLGQSLVVASEQDFGELIAIAIDPESNLNEAGVQSVRVETYAGLASARLKDVSTVVLYDPSSIDADTCDRVESWVNEGGGLMVILGPGFRSAEEWNTSPIRKLLPGTIKRLTRRPDTDRGIILNPSNPNHPIWSIFEMPVDEVPWANYPIFRHWDIEELSESAFPLMRFTQNDMPAIIEEYRGQGRILTWAVPYPDSAEQPWSELFRTSSSPEWPFGLFEGSLRYLASPNRQQTNYFVDQRAFLENDPSLYPSKYMLFDPKGEQAAVEASDSSLDVSFTKLSGFYRLKGLRPQGIVLRGFSVNVDRSEINLDRITEDLLQNGLGESNFRLARDRDGIEFSLGEGRSGRELTPYILVIVVLLFMAEQAMASRFYATANNGRNATGGSLSGGRLKPKASNVASTSVRA